MASDAATWLIWLAWVQCVMMLAAILLCLRALFRLKTIEDLLAQESKRSQTMADAVTAAAMDVATQTAGIAERLRSVTDAATAQAAEESMIRHKALGADLTRVLQATHDLSEQLTKKIERPVLTETIHEATHELAEELGKKIDVGIEKADASHQAANHANEKIAVLTELVSKQQEQQADTVKHIPRATGGS